MIFKVPRQTLEKQGIARVQHIVSVRLSATDLRNGNLSAAFCQETRIGIPGLNSFNGTLNAG
jgi:hypothetical protein